MHSAQMGQKERRQPRCRLRISRPRPDYCPMLVRRGHTRRIGRRRSRWEAGSSGDRSSSGRGSKSWVQQPSFPFFIAPLLNATTWTCNMCGYSLCSRSGRQCSDGACVAAINGQGANYKGVIRNEGQEALFSSGDKQSLFL